MRHWKRSDQIRDIPNAGSALNHLFLADLRTMRVSDAVLGGEIIVVAIHAGEMDLWRVSGQDW